MRGKHIIQACIMIKASWINNKQCDKWAWCRGKKEYFSRDFWFCCSMFFFCEKKMEVFAPRLELGTSRVWGDRHNQLGHANCQPPTRIELVTFSLRRRCSANWAIEAYIEKPRGLGMLPPATLGRKMSRRAKKTKAKLHVGESNPGRLRDRQKCYQLHQHGTDSSEFG